MVTPPKTTKLKYETYLARGAGYEKLRSREFAQPVDVDDFLLRDTHLRQTVKRV